ncbi:50S ribosomal protein L25 [bacterium]|nr:50S ribosomal protein L25 [candidate division CSSED10-310 bacterium]
MKLNAQVKPTVGKSTNRKVRRSGNVPAVMYGRSQDAIPLILNQQEVERVLSTGGGRRIQDMTVQGLGDSDAETHVMFKDIQRNPITGELIHLDLYCVRKGQALTMHLPIVLRGQARGVVDDNGALQFLTREVMIECLPKDLPDCINVDISDLGIGDNISLGDLQLPKGVVLADEPVKTVASVISISSGTKHGEGEDAGEAEAGAAS